MAREWMKGNNFWTRRSKHGRDRLFDTPEDLWKGALEYFRHVDKNPFFMAEQVKQPGKGYVDSEGEYVAPEYIISLPKLKPYTLKGLCLFLHCNVGYFSDFKKSLSGKEDQKSLDFSEVIRAIEETVYNQKFSGAAAGFFNSNLIARELGLVDKTEVKQQGSLEITMTKEETRKIADDLEKDL